MGRHHQTHLPAIDLKGVVLENKGSCQSSSALLWRKALERLRRQKTHRRKMRSGVLGEVRKPKILMKRKASLEGFRKPGNEVEVKVRTLQGLVPNGKSLGLDGLFRETADYVQSLQMQVKVMQIIVQVLSRSNPLEKGGYQLSM